MHFYHQIINSSEVKTIFNLSSILMSIFCILRRWKKCLLQGLNCYFNSILQFNSIYLQFNSIQFNTINNCNKVEVGVEES